MRIALLPLDSRPCNWQFPAHIGRIAGVEVIHPDPADLGDLHAPADTSAMAAWLEQAARGADAVAVSADMLIYGGLVASRKADISPQEAQQRLEVIKRIRRRRVPMLIFGTVMRVAPTIDSEHGRAVAQDLMRLLWLSSKASRTSEDVLAIGELQERIPPEVIAEYQAARESHHAVNLMLRDLGREQGIRVLFYQDDATPRGPHAAEARDLGGAIPGADEAGVMAVASASMGARPLHVQVEYGSERDAAVVCLWEDRPISEVVDLHRAALGDRVTSGEQPGVADAVLFVHTPAGFQTDLASAPPQANRAYEAEEFAARIGLALDGPLPVGVADTRYCNGADLALIEAMRGRGLLARLGAHAGWNTSSNTIGTALAHLAALTAGRRLPDRASRLASARAHYEFLFHRLLDDYGYQCLLRPQANSEADRHGASPLDLGDEAAAIEQFVAERLESLASELFASEFEGVPLLADEPDGPRVSALADFQAGLPWGRTFEAAVRFTLEVE